MKSKLPKLRWKVLKVMDYIATDLKEIDRAKERITANLDRLWVMLAETTRKDD